LKIVYLALGSNMGDREVNLRRALDDLQSRDLRLRRASGLYETEPMGLREQSWFLNQVAEFETELFPLQLLQRIHRIERALGRRRTVPNGPRTVDIDIVLYANAIVKTPELEVPHPRYRERRFVLEPLAELNAALKDPVTGQTVAAMLQAVRSQTVRPFPPAASSAGCAT
jgi:2-amino-4-hydroxy-6-hydroxymethyldihydropteridine diphosphokinase